MIRELVIISGKGGTGKTSISCSLAHLADRKVIADCDVDAADLHLVLNHRVVSDQPFRAGSKAFINSAICNNCGTCTMLCRFDAIGDFFKVNTFSCEGCGVCAAFCPENAIEMVEHESGRWFVSETDSGPFVHARLAIADGNSGKLVTIIRKKAHEIAEERGLDLIIVDGPPGTGCPVIASITGASYILIITEPTASGLHDLRRTIELAAHFRIRSGVCVNRADINREVTSEIKEYCETKGISFLGTIPYDKNVSAAQIAGRSIVEHSDGPASSAIKELWQRISEEI